MRKAINGFFWLVGLVVVLAVYFFVPLGQYTLYEHTLRIAATEPAQELGDELGHATRELGERAVDEWEDRSEIRREASGEEPETDDGTMRLRVEPDGVHLGDDVLSPTELRERVREARRVAGELHAIIEAADGVPTPEVQGILEMLREEHVSVAP
ncbi:MAG: hypothetical protein KC619_28720 [Myxococcales bacterium]|nr:hypothetical protein [Myxococcales bacterium]